MLEIQLHFISAIVILLAALVPIYLTIRLKDNLRKLVVILSLFLLTHSVYHILGLLGASVGILFEDLGIGGHVPGEKFHDGAGFREKVHEDEARVSIVPQGT